MKKVLKNKKVMTILVVILSLLGINQIINADNNPGKITLTKTATKISSNFEENNPEYGRLANVTLKVEANPYTEQETTMDKLDIILVLDSSGSMDWTDDGKSTNNDSKKRITALKNTATDFVNTMIADDDKVQIGIVDYAKSVKNTQVLTDDKEKLTNFINKLSANGGTNTQSGIKKADELLDSSRSDAKKLVIILTDGVPTYFTSNGTTYGNGSTDAAVCLNYSLGMCTNSKRPSDAAKEALDDLKANHNTTDVYTIKFGTEEQKGDSETAAEKLARINPASREGAKPVYKNVTVLTGEDLEKEFQNIQDATRNLIGKNSEVVDIIPKEFKLTDDAKKDLEAQDVKVVENEDGTTTLHWTLGDIEAGEAKAKTLSFDVIAEDEYHGSMYTNQTENYESATLNTTIVAGNPYYKNTEDKNETLKFEAPVVNIPAITNDDHYKDNPSYIGTAQTPINGTTILNNDLDKITKNDKDKAETIITVKDSIIIDENENTVSLSENQYQLKDNDGKLLGTLIMHEDGTFHFTAEEDVTGEVSFNYHIKTTVTKDGKEEYVYSNSSTVTLKINERAKTEVTGTKTWNDGNNQDGLRPENITVKLLANGQVTDTKTVNAKDNWSYNFNNLYKYEAGHENDENYIIKYTIEEVKVTGYTTVIDGTNIINTHTPEVIDVTGAKTWNDNSNQDGIRPDSITVNLFADGNKITSQEVTKNNDWKYSFNNLPKYENGQEINYTITEEAVEGYETTIDGLNITNIHTPEKTSVSGTKIWNDNNNQDGVRPENITVNLFANGEKIDSKVVTEEENWTYTFDNLDKYSNGEEIEYTVTENEVKDYTTEVTGYDIKNTHTPETTVVSGTKTWDDFNNQDGIRPESITVNLFANGEKIDSKDVTEEDNWTYTFDNLDKYSNGEEIKYTVTETVINGYTAEITGYNIKNTHTPDLYNEDGKYTVTKVWDDNNNQDGIRGSYTVTLTGRVDGEKVYEDSQTLTKDKTSYTWSNLQKYNNGKVIEYTVDETEVPTGYTKSVDGNVITNTHTPDLYNEDGKYTVTKVWNDNDNQDGIRGSYTVTLTGRVDGEEVYKDSQTLTKDQLTYTWENLPKNNDGKVIEYTVDETKVPAGYTKSVDGNVITNTHTPETIDLTATKTWNDNNNQDGIRPDSITVNLFADGNKITSQEVTKNNDWKYSFNNLPKYENGQEINYTITEEAVEGYETTIDGLNITNIHTPEKTSVSGTKIWNDFNNQDGVRPENITVNLFANGEKIDSKVVTEEENWTYTFDNLDKYSNGEEIEYTVTENEVKDYTTEVTGYDIINTHTPKKININGEKIWEDENNIEGLRPESITVRLFANGEEVSSTTVTADNNWKYTFSNLDQYANGKEITYTVEEDAVEHYDMSLDKDNKFVIVNTHSPKNVEIKGTKTWIDEDNCYGRPDYIIVKLTGTIDDKVVVEASTKVTAKDSWSYSFADLPEYREGKLIKYTVDEEDIRDYDKTINGYDITNTYNPERIDISGTKTWIDNNNQDGVRPESITIKLLANGVVVAETTATAETNWSFEFKDQVKYANGQEITYTVEEEAVKDYITEVDGYNITNTHEPEKTKVSGAKTWNDNNNQDGIRPESITIRLFANDKEVSSQTVKADNNWKYSFNNLPKYENGQEIKYTITEDVVEGYTTEITGYNIKNTHTTDLYNEDGKYTVTKIWDDNNNQDGIRGSYTVTLTGHVEGEEVYKNSQTLTKDQLTYTWENLQKNNNGKEIVYTVDETEVPAGYNKSVDGNVITNTHTPDLYNEDGKYTVTKIWNDNENQDGIRGSYTVTLTGHVDGEEVYKNSQTLTEDKTSYTWSNLPKYNNGKEIVYTVDETEVPAGYTKSVDGNIITNTHTPDLYNEDGKYTVTKVWNDNNNQDGIRGDYTVTLTGHIEGKEIFKDSQTLTKDQLTYTWNNLQKYNNGKVIEYTVDETEVPTGYTKEVNGNVITNTHIPDLYNEDGKYTVTKVWNDNENQDGIRESYTVTLTGHIEGKEVYKNSQTLTEDTTSYTWSNLQKKNNGKDIEYTVDETEVPAGYTKSINGNVITNTHKPIKIDITGQKVWVDENNIEGLRPNEITVRLLANGQEVSSTTVTADNNWAYTFTNLDKFANGQEINYTVEEDAVEHYDMSLDKDNKFVIVNTHSPKNVEVTGTKTWIDEDNRYGRPDHITVKLTGKVGDKVVVEETKDVTSEDNWNYSFTNLPEYREGMLITYTIDEEDVKDYDKSINGFNITNTYTPETINISGTKTWNDNNNQDGIRPDYITINLLANGVVVAETKATAETNWNFEFKDQVKFANGQEINYTVEEISVEGYTTEIEGFNVTNNHTPATVSYTVTKVWNDNNNNDNIRPESITVRLIADGEEVATQVIDEANNWTYSFADLPKYRDGGIEIKYEIIEDEVKGYEPSYTPSISETDPNQTNVIITNTHENEKNEITINKIWDDLDNPSRPNSIKVIIYADGEEIRVIELTKDMNWTYTLTDLDKYKDGKLINYTIEELPVEGYTTTYNGFDIINSMIYGKGGDVEELPPQTGINTSITPSANNMNLICLSLIALFMILTSFKRTEEN